MEIGLFITLIVFYLIIEKVDNNLFFYGFLGASARTLFSFFQYFITITVYSKTLKILTSTY